MGADIRGPVSHQGGLRFAGQCASLAVARWGGAPSAGSGRDLGECLIFPGDMPPGGFGRGGFCLVVVNVVHWAIGLGEYCMGES